VKLEDIAAQRKVLRNALIAKRLALTPDARTHADALISQRLAAHLADRALHKKINGALAFYWPMQGEFDAREVMRVWLAQTNGVAALPVVVTKHAPLVFRPWQPGAPMQAGVFGTTVPVDTTEITPTTLIIPLVGFDRARYRLGYGGGYYDRTLAALPAGVHTIGLGYACGAIDTIHPQPHDYAMDCVITEAGTLCA
jgi:5-formyltetrahydrofolate cyclo-ligase